MKRAEQTSFFYLLLALSCFDRAHRVRHGASLRSIGRDYVRKAHGVGASCAAERAPLIAEAVPVWRRFNAA